MGESVLCIHGALPKTLKIKRLSIWNGYISIFLEASQWNCWHPASHRIVRQDVIFTRSTITQLYTVVVSDLPGGWVSETVTDVALLNTGQLALRCTFTVRVPDVDSCGLCVYTLLWLVPNQQNKDWFLCNAENLEYQLSTRSNNISIKCISTGESAQGTLTPSVQWTRADLV